MFRKETSTQANGSRKGSDANASPSLNLIGAGTVIKGDIETSGDIRIDGTLIGTLHCSKVVLGETAIVEGNIFCQNADVSGSVSGNISVDDLLSLKSTAKVIGDILTGKLMVEAGADFIGNCKMKAYGSEKPAREPAGTGEKGAGEA